MRILLLPGIWPPDVGGPATHGPDFARFLVERGHDVHVVTMADGSRRSCRARSRPSRAGTRSPSATRMLAAKARGARAQGRRHLRLGDVRRRRGRIARPRDVRSSRSSSPTPPTSARTATASSAGTLEEFQAAPGGAARRAEARRAPRRFGGRARSSSRARTSREIARGWGARRGQRIWSCRTRRPTCPTWTPSRGAGHVRVRGPADAPEGARDRRSTRSARVPEARLVVVGDGPERAALERRARDVGLNGRVRVPRRAAARRRCCAIVADAWAARALERLGEPAARRRRGAGRRDAGRRHRRRRRARGRPRRGERAARAARSTRRLRRRDRAAASTTPGCANRLGRGGAGVRRRALARRGSTGELERILREAAA